MTRIPNEHLIDEVKKLHQKIKYHYLELGKDPTWVVTINPYGGGEQQLLQLYTSTCIPPNAEPKGMLERIFLWLDGVGQPNPDIYEFLPTYRILQRCIIDLYIDRIAAVGEHVTEKPVNIQNATQLREEVGDVEIFGDPDTWKLICKASSESQNWMKSTKAMEIEGVGCLVQVTTQTLSGVAEAITLVPNVVIQEVFGEDGATVISRRLVRSPMPIDRSMFNAVDDATSNISLKFQPNPVEEPASPSHRSPQSEPVKWLARLIRREILNVGVTVEKYASELGISRSDLSQLAAEEFTISLPPIRREPHDKG